MAKRKPIAVIGAPKPIHGIIEVEPGKLLPCPNDHHLRARVQALEEGVCPVCVVQLLRRVRATRPLIEQYAIEAPSAPPEFVEVRSARIAAIIELLDAVDALLPALIQTKAHIPADEAMKADA
jgi:hypothetical protein